jgi:bifunctional isochorismate lyase / aryl carrier protein
MAIAAIAPYEIPTAHSWPPCRAPWRFEPGRAALLVHDMQAYFLEPFDPELSPLRPLLRNLRQLLHACTRLGVPVIHSAQPGEQSRGERGLLWDLWGPGIVESPGLARLAFAFEPKPSELLLHKRRYSAFHETELTDMLRERGRDQLVICGVYAHIGCLATATDGFMRGVQPFVVSDATADFSAEDHAVALRQVARTCGVVTTTAELLLPLHLQVLRTHLVELLGPTAADIDVNDDLGDHGLDSLRGMQLLERVLPAKHGIDFEELVAARSIERLAGLMLPREPALQ